MNTGALIPFEERDILANFKDGGEIKSVQEWEVLKKWAGVGFVTFGLSSGTAKLTESGKDCLDW